jgi:hypothetical protein
MLNYINKWSFIVKLKDYNSKFKYHYKTIYNKFVYWSNNNVFYNAFYNYHLKKNTNLLLINMVVNALLLILNIKRKKLLNYQFFQIKITLYILLKFLK